MNIPFEKLKDLNKSADVDWQRTKPQSGNGVIGSLEGRFVPTSRINGTCVAFSFGIQLIRLVRVPVFHQLHCLDFIRQYTYRDQYDYSKQPAFDGTPAQVREVCGSALRSSSEQHSGSLCQSLTRCMNSSARGPLYQQPEDPSPMCLGCNPLSHQKRYSPAAGD